jgi:hypothetical protein
VRPRKLTVRTIALMGAASAAIHQLRYAIGYGENASSALAAHPHGYLTAALPGLITALVIAIAASVARAATPRQAERRSPSVFLVWAACAIALATIYGAQETLEGAGAFAGGGWIGLALAVPAGLVVALAMRGADVASVPGIGFGWLVARMLASAELAHPEARRGRIFARLDCARGPPQAFVV